MEFRKLEIEGLIEIIPRIFGDERGYFYESFNVGRYSELGVSSQFYQDNISKSVKGTVRGLHYQIGNNAQGKLVSVLFGKVLDVAVDIRFGSPTFGKYHSIELSSENKKQFWIPPGFAHGFSVLSEEALFHYKCTAPYDPLNERCIRFNDEKLSIDWKVQKPIVSDKDLTGVDFIKIKEDFKY
jgi:dTDP-4-dehydrorhamnose 3,5-epimerase